MVSGRLREAIRRERRSLRSALVRCRASVVGGVVPLGDPFGTRRVLRAVRLRGEGAAGRSDVHGGAVVVGHVEVLASRQRSRARGLSAAAYSTQSPRINGGSGRRDVTRR